MRPRFRQRMTETRQQSAILSCQHDLCSSKPLANEKRKYSLTRMATIEILQLETSQIKLRVAAVIIYQYRAIASTWYGPCRETGQRESGERKGKPIICTVKLSMCISRRHDETRPPQSRVGFSDPDDLADCSLYVLQASCCPHQGPSQRLTLIFWECQMTAPLSNH